MLIHIIRPGNNYDYVKDFILDRLIERKKIIVFRRSTGWVTLGVDPIRVTMRNNLKTVSAGKMTIH